MKYSDLLMWQYKLPKAIAEIDMKSQFWIDFMNDCMAFAASWDIDNAEKYYLDVLGRIFGVSRTSVSMTEKDYLTYYEKTGGLGWGKGRWYVAGEAFRETILLNDAEMKFLIRARIWKLYQNPSLDYLTDALQDLTGQDAFIVDNYDMTMTIYYGSEIELDSFIKFAVENLDILPRPVGVKYNYEQASAKYFGFDGDEFTRNFGFGEGRFIDA
ncbi:MULTISPECIES: DUF2612 domain-containing protein [Enterobacteriaceae]|uniref:DUF2612 domain-containing protein n=1 Tax=Enterobacteriaceae TaxID=543 RepID=UPI002E2AAEF6|nr:DUF2612 domain-containing protein [Klebsiella pneumoniae]MED6004881.1 DUF2612 domain-containing protein [Klebsiella pneumoniae]MED6058305.1 DUF2612 domain-containing protein [Klebsiella pneumoniae]